MTVYRPRKVPPGLPPHEIYCDESETKGGYELFGGIWLSHYDARRLRRTIARIRTQFNYPREFKWRKASGSSLSPTYADLASKLTQIIYAERVHFHCIVRHPALVDVKQYHEGDVELAYFKFASLLIGRRLEAGKTYVITIDRRHWQKSDRLSDLKRVLNHVARRDLGITYDCVREVRARPSRGDDLLQMADLLLGAVGYHVAGLHKNPKSSLGKTQLAARIAQGIRKEDLAFASPNWERPFNIWRWTPRPGTK
ncbi:DUF3800 domain-containing protein [Candidatus Palauibacter sp.]|uniref:DUF3800 domain-containing protein n=1 Tax=Candidatus Palauibacter sp. TaxID=3101350 RepID=UPI003CC515FC